MCVGLTGVAARPAASQTAEPATTPVRADRAVLIGVCLPDAFGVFGHDSTVPLPGLHVRFNLSPRLALGLSGGLLPYETNGQFSTVHGGGRFYLAEPRWAPYLLADVGVWANRADEGDDQSYPFVFAGGGLEYAGASGFAAWVELAPALVSYNDQYGAGRSLAAGWYGALGVGFRVRTAP
jgi:hypothetical protein